MIKNDFFIREPLLPTKFFVQEIMKRENEEILFLLEEKNLRNAIEISSPVFLKEFVEFDKKRTKKKRKIIETVLNYASRASLRPTPFALFCGVGIGNFHDGNTSEKNELSFEVKYNPSSEWISYLINKIEEDDDIFQCLYLRINPLLIFENKKIIILENDLSQSKEVFMSPPLKFLIEKIRTEDLSIKLLIKLMVTEFEVDEGKVKKFIREAYENRIIFSNIRPIFPYLSTLNHLVSFFEQELLIDSNLYNLLIRLKETLSSLNVPYSQIKELMYSITPDFKGEVFHIDSKICSNHNLSYDFKKEINRYNDMFKNFLHSMKDIDVLKKIKLFYNTYYNINDEIPILDFLFSEHSLKNLSLDFNFELDESARKKLEIIDRWIEKNGGKKKALEVDGKLIEEIKNVNKLYQNNSNRDYAFVINMIENDRDTLIVNNHLTGSSPNALMGRFAYLFPEEEIFLKQNSNDDCIEAEILTWSETNSKINNLFSSRKYHNYSIRCANINDNEVIEISDILVGLQGEKIYLKSRKLNKIILPCQENMVNLEHAFTRIEKFLYLVKLQNDGISQSIFSFYDSNKVSVPRITYKNLIISRAKFKMKLEDFPISIKNNFAYFNIELKKWIKVLDVPNIIGLNSLGDIQYYNLNNESHKKILYKLLLKNKILFLEELGIEESKLENNVGKYLEYVFYSQEEQLNKNMEINSNMVCIKENIRTFEYDDSLYLKLYMREIYADQIIVSLLSKLYRIYKENMIFFIRYVDPEFHLRIRILKLKDEKYRVLKEIMGIITEFNWFEDNVITKYSIENYVPEINRYGGRTCMDLIHEYFHFESQLQIKLIYLLNQKNNDIEELIFGLILIIFKIFVTDIMLAKNILKDISKKVSYDTKIRNLIKKINIKDYTETKIIKKFEVFEIDTVEFFNSLHKLEKQNFLTTSTVEIGLSLVHMFINRLGNSFSYSEEQIHKILLGILNKETYGR